MTCCAFIVVIEDYPKSLSTSRKLPGSIANAERCAVLFEKNLGVSRDQITFCSSSASHYRTHGDTRSEIKDAVKELVRKRANETEQLWVFVTGHGVMQPIHGAVPQSDVLLCSDFESSNISGDACLKLDELTTFLSRALGAGTHLWFVDACRTTDPTINPASLGLSAQQATSGTAGYFQLLSAPAGNAAATDSRFVDSLLESLNGDGVVDRDSTEEGKFWVTFRSVARSVESKFAKLNRGVEIKSLAEQADVRLCSVDRPGAASTILDSTGRKIPPVELLTNYDEVVFLGETNGQLPEFVKAAFSARNNRSWANITVLSIEDLTDAGRPGTALAELEAERNRAEEFFCNDGVRMTNNLSLYRYGYAGTFGSLWTARDGKRRVHVSPKLLGTDIRFAPSNDYIDFPSNQHPTINAYAALFQQVIVGSRCIFSTSGTNESE